MKDYRKMAEYIPHSGLAQWMLIGVAMIVMCAMAFVSKIVEFKILSWLAGK